MLARMATTNPSDTEEYPLGALLREARSQRGLSLEGAAARAGIAKGTWHTIERGHRADGTPYRPSIKNVITAARAVHADPRKALVLAGYDPKIDAPELASTPTITGPEVLAKIERLTPSQRAAALIMIDTMLDPDRELPEHGVLFEVELDEEPPRGGSSGRPRTARRRQTV